MRSVLTSLALVPLAACAATGPPAGDMRLKQETACTAIIAAHVGRPPAEVTSRWLSEEGGVAKIEARDDGRVHVCDVSSTGRVIDYVHPGA